MLDPAPLPKDKMSWCSYVLTCAVCKMIILLLLGFVLYQVAFLALQTIEGILCFVIRMAEFRLISSLLGKIINEMSIDLTQISE